MEGTGAHLAALLDDRLREMSAAAAAALNADFKAMREELWQSIREELWPPPSASLPALPRSTMATPAPSPKIVNYGPNNPGASTDNFPPSFPLGRALPSAMLDQLTPTETEKDTYHCIGNANDCKVASNWAKVLGEPRELVRIINDEWVCFFWYPSKEECTVRCVNIYESYREVWYKRIMGSQELELQLVIPSGHGNVQTVELHQKVMTLNSQWCHRDFMRFLGKDEPISAVVHVEEQRGTNMRTETAVLTNGQVVVKHEDPRDRKKARTCIRNLDGGMVVYGAEGERLFVLEPKGQDSGTITYWHRVGWDARDYPLKQLKRNGTWKRAFELKPGPDPNPKKRKQRERNEEGLTEEQREAYEDEAEQSSVYDGTADEARDAAEYDDSYDGPDMDDVGAYYESNC